MFSVTWSHSNGLKTIYFLFTKLENVLQQEIQETVYLIVERNEEKYQDSICISVLQSIIPDLST
jgi:hypothetical protein